MPPENLHINGSVRTWDGHKYTMMPLKEAKALEKKGMVQITNNLTAAQLKHPGEFKTANIKAKKKTYANKELRAEA